MKEINNFEKDIRRTYNLPDITPNDVERIKKGILSNKLLKGIDNKPLSVGNKIWSYALVALLVLAGLFVAIGPGNVLAQIEKIFGDIPEVAVVDTNETFFQLDKSVSDTKDGITLTIETAFLSADQTIITFSISDLPLEIRPIKFSEPVCNTPAYLTLPDGSEIQSSHLWTSLQSNGTYEHLLMFNNPWDTEIKQATLVFPCLEGAVLGKGPMDWQFVLDFIPAQDH